MIKKLYSLIALLALINLFAVAGLMGFLVASGRLTGERVEQIAKVLRGEWPVQEAPATQPAVAATQPQRSGEEIAAMQVQRELVKLHGERLLAESQQRLALGESLELRVLRRLEEIQAREEAFKSQKQAFKSESQQEGFTQALDMYSNMDANLAKDLLKNNEKDADAVRLLTAMDANRRKKIINACKSPDEKVWIRRILNQVMLQDDSMAAGVDGSGGLAEKTP